MVVLPGSKVLLLGLKLGKYSLNPWVYSIKEGTWSNKLTPNAKDLPPVPYQFNAHADLGNEIDNGSAVLL